MSAPLKLTAFAAALAAIFAVAVLAGGALDPAVSTATSDGDEEETDMEATHVESATEAGHGGGEVDEAQALPGVAVSAAGYRLELERSSFDSRPGQTLRFRIAGESGETVRDFEVEHERPMHLIVVRRDFEAFQHLHPRQLPDGSWRVEADLSRPGSYRAFADFATGEQSLTLGADLSAAGRYDPVPLPQPQLLADAGDGYEVEISRSEVTGGELSPVEFTVSRNGEPVGELDPYLGADGHLVALREGDQAFLHTHPRGEPGGVGPIAFDVEYPSAGHYRLFLQFKHRGEVRTAEFTQEATDGGH